jgi:galactonate dehydratase
MHYNSDDADLFTYLADPSVFAVKDGYVTTPSGEY